MNVEHQIEGTDRGEIFASATTVLVSYDYHQQTTILIPENWRITIRNFEGASVAVQ